MRLSFLKIFLLSLFLLSDGCHSQQHKDETVLLSEAEINYYLTVRDHAKTDKFITHFAKVNLPKADAIITGAVASVYYDIPNAERGTIETIEKIWGIDVPRKINVFTSEKGFLEACEGEQLFVLRVFTGGNSAHIVTNFKIEPAIRAEQIATTKELLDIEKIKNTEKRKEAFKKKCYSCLHSKTAWIANVWAYQLMNFCQDYPKFFNLADLKKITDFEVEYVRKYPQMSAVIKNLKMSVINLIKFKFKKLWLKQAMSASSAEQRQLAVKQLIDVMLSSYRAAFSYTDRVVLHSLIQHEKNSKVLKLLMDADLRLRALLSK